MRIFKGFPKDIKCKICNTSDDKECILVIFDGTEHDGIAEAIPIHTDCLTDLHYKSINGNSVIYKRFIEKK